MTVLAVVVGLLGGYCSIGFRHLVDGITSLWPGEVFSTDVIRGLPWYWVVAIPAVGGFLAGSITRWFAPEAKGHGVPEVMEAVALKQGRIRPRLVVAKALASGVTIGSGGSVGREGPIVQIGAALGSTVGQFLKMDARKLRTLVGCGAAAGIAATFNAPVAGALFAVEVILGDFAVRQFSPIVVSSVSATVVARAHLGNHPAFVIPPDEIGLYRLVHPAELVTYAVLGMAAGLVAFGFVRTLCFAEDTVDDRKLPLPLTAAVGGALVGVVALGFPDVLGVGYEAIERNLVSPDGALLLAALVVAKIVAVSITLGSGGSGGVFAPSLFVGAMLGGLAGLGMQALDVVPHAPAGTYSMVGMGALVAATTQAPIATILIIFELTGDYRIILPLMIAAILATEVARRLSDESIYTIKLARRGVRIRGGQDVAALRAAPVSDLVREAPAVDAARPVTQVAERLVDEGLRTVYVTRDGGRLAGTITMRELHPVLRDPRALDAVVAIDVVRPIPPAVSIDDNLETVLQQLDAGYRDELPVLENDRLAGIVRIEDVLRRYRALVARRDADA